MSVRRVLFNLQSGNTKRSLVFLMIPKLSAERGSGKKGSGLSFESDYHCGIVQLPHLGLLRHYQAIDRQQVASVSVL